MGMLFLLKFIQFGSMDKDDSEQLLEHISPIICHGKMCGGGGVGGGGLK